MSTTTFLARPHGYCAHCGRTIGWHAGTKCYPRDTTGMPKPAPAQAPLKEAGERSDEC